MKKDAIKIDWFGPIGAGTMQLQSNVSVRFVATEEDLPAVDELFGRPFIGLDSEWRP